MQIYHSVVVYRLYYIRMCCCVIFHTEFLIIFLFDFFKHYQVSESHQRKYKKKYKQNVVEFKNSFNLP